MFKRLSFKTKLLSLCLLISSISVAVGAIGYIGLTNVETDYVFITDKSMPRIRLANHMFLEYRRIRIALRTLGLPGITPAAATKAIHEAEQAIAQYEEAKKEYMEMGFEPGQKEHFDKLELAWVDFKEVGARVIKLYRTGRPEDLAMMTNIFFGECPEKAKIFSDAGEELIKFHGLTTTAKIAEAKARGHAANLYAVSAISIGLSIGLLFGFLFATSLGKSIGQVVDRLAENAARVSAASSQIAASSVELSQSTTEQAASLEETASAIEEMSSMVNKSSENAKSTSATSNEAEDKANEGKQVIAQMITSMDEINHSNSEIMTQINNSNQKMAEIIKVIQDIGTKTKVINDIVFQTKLLSFNASVEAARAGEHGKGFAVVAEEVGNLAAMSGNAAKEISEMLEGSIEKVGTIVQETKSRVEVLIASGKQKVESGSQVARQCADVLTDIVSNISSVSRMAGEISMATQEQSQGIREITKAMGQLDTVTQQNAATSEQSARAAEELSEQAESLKAAVDQLTYTIRGGSAKEITALKPAGTTNNLVKFKPRSKAAGASDKSVIQTKIASGESSAPTREHPGFSDV